MGAMLEWKDVTVRYDGKTAVDGVSLSVRAGEWLMICGPNGSGKTSLIEAAGGVLPYGGSILLNGREVSKMKSAARAREMAVLSQDNHVDEAFTVAAGFPRRRTGRSGWRGRSKGPA